MFSEQNQHPQMVGDGRGRVNAANLHTCCPGVRENRSLTSFAAPPSRRFACVESFRLLLLTQFPEPIYKFGLMKTIIVVDDDPDQAELLAEALNTPGRIVKPFSDPIRALATLSDEGAHLLIADLAMPWMGGEDVVVCARIRSPTLKVILVSGHDRGALIAAREGLRFFAKPINFGLLREAVVQALSDDIALSIGSSLGSSKQQEW